MSPPGNAASFWPQSHTVLVGSRPGVDNQRRKVTEDDGVHWCQSKISMQVKKADIKFALVAVQFAEQEERHE